MCQNTHRPLQNLFILSRKEILSCALTKERQSLGFYRLFLDDDYFRLDTKLNAWFQLVVEENSSFVDKKQESPDLVVFDYSRRFQYVQ